VTEFCAIRAVERAAIAAALRAITARRRSKRSDQPAASIYQKMKT